MGSQATTGELATAAKAIQDEPNRWTAQPIIQLSTAPTLCDDAIAPRHVDLRPFTLMVPDVTWSGRRARHLGSHHDRSS